MTFPVTTVGPDYRYGARLADTNIGSLAGGAPWPRDAPQAARRHRWGSSAPGRGLPALCDRVRRTEAAVVSSRTGTAARTGAVRTNGTPDAGRRPVSSEPRAVESCPCRVHTGRVEVSEVQPSQERQPSRTSRFPRRVTDRVEDAAAWVLTAAALFVLLGAVLGGVGVYGGAVDRARTAAHERTLVAAVLVDAPVPIGAQDSLSLRSAHYLDAAGAEHDTVLPVAGSPQAGEIVRVWVDREGRVVDAPLTLVDAVAVGALAGVGITIVGGFVLGSAWLGLRRWLDHRNAAEWGREWYRVEPEWSGRNR
jgi:hypothetical protein